MKDVKLQDEESLEAVAIAPAVVDSKPVVVLPPQEKINNIIQKEEALHYLGLTRKKYMWVILEALEAVKKAEYRDSQGNVKYDEEPDFDRRKWAVEQCAKLFGDYVQQVQADIKVSHSVEELLSVFEKAQRQRLGGLN